MKQTLMLAGVALAFVAGSAQAEGCAYYKQQAALAAADQALDSSPVEGQNPKLLAQLKAEQAMELDSSLPVIHN